MLLPRIAHGADGVLRAADVDRLGMAGVGEANDARRRVDDEIKGRDKHRGRQRFEKVMETLIEFAEKGSRVVAEVVDLLDQNALHRGDQRGVHAMTHDVADEHAGLGVGDLVDREKIASHAAFRQVAVGEAEGAGRLCRAPGEGRITLGEKGLLDFAGHGQFLVHLRLLIGSASAYSLSCSD